MGKAKRKVKKLQTKMVTGMIIMGTLTLSLAYLLFDLGYYASPYNATSKYFFFSAVHWLSIVGEYKEINWILGPLNSKIREKLMGSFYMSLIYHICFHIFTSFQTVVFKMVLDDRKKGKKWPFLGNFGFKATLYLSFCGLGAAMTEQFALSTIYQREPDKVEQHLYLLLYFFGRFRYICIFGLSFSFGMLFLEFVEWPKKYSYFGYVRFFSGRQLNLPLIYLGSSVLGFLSLFVKNVRSGLELCIALNMLSVIGTTWFATFAFSSDDDEKKKDKFIGPAVPGVLNNKKNVKKEKKTN